MGHLKAKCGSCQLGVPPASEGPVVPYNHLPEFEGLLVSHVDSKANPARAMVARSRCSVPHPFVPDLCLGRSWRCLQASLLPVPPVGTAVPVSVTKVPGPLVTRTGRASPS